MIFEYFDSLVHKYGKRVELHNRVLDLTNTGALADFEELRQCADEVLDQEVCSSGSAKFAPVEDVKTQLEATIMDESMYDTLANRESSDLFELRCDFGSAVER